MVTKKALFIAIICGLLSAVLLWFYLTSLENKYRESVKSYPVLVARGYISQGTILKDRMVQITKVPKQYIQPGALRAIDELVDEKGQFIYITLLPVLENEQITKSKLTNVKKEMGLSIVIPDGQIAVPLSANKMTTLGGLVRPGNRVNVLCTFDYEEKSKHCSSTITLFQNVLVLSVGKTMVGSPDRIIEGKTNETERYGIEPMGVSVITLALSPQEASLLTFAREKGTITLTLKPAGDESVQDIKPTKIENIIPGAKQKNSPSSSMKDVQEYMRDVFRK